MGIRESINRNSKAVLLASAILIALMLCVAAFYAKAPATQTQYGSRSWYTTDDGKSWFADEASKLVPFQHDGKPAYRCYVWTCDGGKTAFVSHLERIKAEMLTMLTRAGKTKVDFLDMPPGSLQVKPPATGDANWVDVTDPRATAISTPRCPGGGTGSTPLPVIPH